MFDIIKRRSRSASDLVTSQLFDQNTFYGAFLRDLGNCTNEVVIESPFITSRRMAELLPVFRKLRKRGVHLLINTRHPDEHNDGYDLQAHEAVAALHELGATVLYTGGHHRKLAILDRATVWEGSLNILSYNDSCEIMRKIHSTVLAEQMIRFLRIEKYLRKD